MLKLLLVGDKPSKKNTDPSVAFVGTRSHKTIENWLSQMVEEGAEVVLVNRVDPKFAQLLIHASLQKYKIVALGVEAAQALVNHGITRFFRLPHPSGRNRKLNDKKYVAQVLAQCKQWIKED